MPDRIVGRECRALEGSREKSWPPIVRPVLRNTSGIWDGYIRRQIVAKAAQRLGHPGPQTWETIEIKALGEKVFGRSVGIGFAYQRMDRSDLIGQFCQF
jgi:hypothetical protein